MLGILQSLQWAICILALKGREEVSPQPKHVAEGLIIPQTGISLDAVEGIEMF